MIELTNISKHYGKDIVALDNISLQIGPGEFVYLTGKSGSGKSTLLKLINRQIIASSGQIRVGKFNVTDLKAADVPHLRRQVGVVFQDFKLLPNRTVYENVAYVLEVTGVSHKRIRDRVLETLRIVELVHKADHYPHECSGGEQQRVAIARALANFPEIILADEPTGNLDPRITREIMRVFKRINEMGVAVVMANHNLRLIRENPERVIELEDGRLKSDRSKNHMSIIFSQEFSKHIVL